MRIDAVSSGTAHDFGRYRKFDSSEKYSAIEYLTDVLCFLFPYHFHFQNMFSFSSLRSFISDIFFSDEFYNVSNMIDFLDING